MSLLQDPEEEERQRRLKKIEEERLQRIQERTVLANNLIKSNDDDKNRCKKENSRMKEDQKLTKIFNAGPRNLSAFHWNV